ncbi:hypothetical protein ACYSNU_07335 [Enterococcus sp. LJL120]
MKQKFPYQRGYKNPSASSIKKEKNTGVAPTLVSCNLTIDAKKLSQFLASTNYDIRRQEHIWAK